MDPNQPQSPVAGTPIFQDSQEGGNAKWLWVLIALIVVGSLAFAFVKGIGPFASLKGEEDSEQASPTPAAVIEEIISPTPEATTSASVDKSVAKIRILNGGGKAGAASEAKDFLEAKDWVVSTLGNADSYDFTQTIVRVKSKFASLGSALISDLSSKYSVQPTTEELEATASVDIEVIVGSK